MRYPVNRALAALCCLLVLAPAVPADPCYAPAYYAPAWEYHPAGYVGSKRYYAGYYQRRAGGWYHQRYGYDCYTYAPPATFVRFNLALLLADVPTYGSTAVVVPQGGFGVAPVAPPPQATAPVALQATAPVASPPTAWAGPSPADWKALMGAVQGMDARLQRLERGPAVSPPAAPPAAAPESPPAMPPAQALPADGLSALNSRCASCHDRAVAAASGGGHVLTEGGRLVAGARLRQAAARAVNARTMPLGPGGRPAPLAAGEAALLTGTLTN